MCTSKSQYIIEEGKISGKCRCAYSYIIRRQFRGLFSTRAPHHYHHIKYLIHSVIDKTNNHGDSSTTSIMDVMGV